MDALDLHSECHTVYQQTVVVANLKLVLKYTHMLLC